MHGAASDLSFPPTHQEVTRTFDLGRSSIFSSTKLASPATFRSKYRLSSACKLIQQLQHRLPFEKAFSARPRLLIVPTSPLNPSGSRVELPISIRLDDKPIDRPPAPTPTRLPSRLSSSDSLEHAFYSAIQLRVRCSRPIPREPARSGWRREWRLVRALVCSRDPVPPRDMLNLGRC